MKTESSYEIGGSAHCFRAAISIRGSDLDPVEISSLLGVTPESTHKKGDPRARGAPFNDGLWSAECTRKDGATVEQLVLQVLDRLPQNPVLWQTIASRFSVTVGVGIHVAGGNRDVAISKETLRRLAEFQASIWIDAYVVDEKET